MKNIYTNELFLLWSVVNFLILYTLACGKKGRNISVKTTQFSFHGKPEKIRTNPLAQSVQINNTIISCLEARLSVTCGFKDAEQPPYFETYYNAEGMD